MWLTSPKYRLLALGILVAGFTSSQLRAESGPPEDYAAKYAGQYERERAQAPTNVYEMREAPVLTDEPMPSGFNVADRAPARKYSKAKWKKAKSHHRFAKHKKRFAKKKFKHKRKHIAHKRARKHRRGKRTPSSLALGHLPSKAVFEQVR